MSQRPRRYFGVSRLGISFGMVDRECQKEKEEFVSDSIKKNMPNAKFDIESRFYDSDGYGACLIVEVDFNQKVAFSKIMSLLKNMFQESNLVIHYFETTGTVSIYFEHV